MINAVCPECGKNKFTVDYEGDEERDLLREKEAPVIEKITGGLACRGGSLGIICINCGWEHAFYLGE